MCHAYGYLPSAVLGMAYRHFTLLAAQADLLERRRAMYTALAFHDPKQLQPEQKKIIKANKKNAAEILRLVNG